MPVFRLSDLGKRADVKLPKESRLALSVETVRQFILHQTLDNHVAPAKYLKPKNVNPTMNNPYFTLFVVGAASQRKTMLRATLS